MHLTRKDLINVLDGDAIQVGLEVAQKQKALLDSAVFQMQEQAERSGNAANVARAQKVRKVRTSP